MQAHLIPATLLRTAGSVAFIVACGSSGSQGDALENGAVGGIEAGGDGNLLVGTSANPGIGGHATSNGGASLASGGATSNGGAGVASGGAGASGGMGSDGGNGGTPTGGVVSGAAPGLGGTAMGGLSVGGSSTGGLDGLGGAITPLGGRSSGGALSLGGTSPSGGSLATGGGGGIPPPLGGEAGAAAGSGGDAGNSGAGNLEATFEATPKPRVLVLTDISNEPDDEESLVRFLVYSNEYDVEGLVATTSTHLKTGPREDLIRAELDAYDEIMPNLSQHATGYPSAEALRAVTATGQTSYGMEAVGSGKATAGSELIIEAADKEDSRPLWIAGWCGMNTLAQALTDLRDSRTEAEIDAFIEKLRVYSISDQDDAGAWLRSEFPDLYYVVSPSDQTANDYHLSTWSGISGDEHYDNGPGYNLELVSNAWLTANVRTGHGPLGELYPEWKYIMEGDTPSFLGLIDNGLGSSTIPSYGGWGGRYVLSRPAGESREIWTNSPDSFEYEPGLANTSNQATVWRWRPDYQYDLAARMDWCVAESFDEANHNPVLLLNGDSTKGVMHILAEPGAMIQLSAEGTSDPDGDTVSLKWFIYEEAGTLGSGATLSQTEGLTTLVRLPEDGEGTLHVILDAQDDGDPPLSAYRRAVIEVGD